MRYYFYLTTLQEIFDMADFLVPGNRYLEKLRIFKMLVGNGAFFDIKVDGKGFSEDEIGTQAKFEGRVHN